jgi:hypothetical protein
MKLFEASNVLQIGWTLADTSKQRGCGGDGWRKRKMISLSTKPLGLLGWLLSILLGLTCSDPERSDAPTQLPVD